MTNKFIFIDHYKENTNNIVLVGKNKDGKHYFIVKDYNNYYAVPYEERPKKRSKNILKIEPSKDIYGNKLAKIIVIDDSVIINTNKQKYSKVFESDIRIHDRFKINYNIKSGFSITEYYGGCFGCSVGGYHTISKDDVEGW